MKARHPGMGDMGLPLGLAVRLLPTPRTSDTNGAGSHGDGGPDLRTAVSLLPTPRASDGEKASPNQKFGDGSPTLANAAARLLPTPTASDHGSNYATAEERTAAGHQAYLSNVMTSLVSEVLLPTPRASDTGTPGRRAGEDFRPPLSQVVLPIAAGSDGTGPDAPEHEGTAWGPYATAVERWESLTRPAPRPVDDQGRLSPAFVEWLMGLPEGHVITVPGLSRGARLKALGNGVVPQQAAAALGLLLDRFDDALRAG
ncbi:hypothetical protein [Streptomyces sp. YPW6]|uniref:hypothetical protein n=1 Tax=Streptomyces sp. YPW6 TaxID=2840373 RepID=UPI003D763E6A